ncbi:MAG: hypothetical protein HYS80_00275, partial [Candidatus Aenigmarchaeota archaeon]|nr:hypothetical protein [Candidatus Aenigmarchaeota archaeon]
MRLLYRLAVVFILFLIIYGLGNLSTTGRFSGTSGGEIFGLSISPAKPLFGEEARLSVGVKNIEKTTTSYKLVYIIIKDGLVKLTSDIDFTLLSNGTITLTPSFIPDDLGEHQLILELYDESGRELLDTVTKKFDVVSEIGPFDLAINMPTSIISPGESVPAILTIGNLGEKGAELNVNVNIKCYNQSDIVNSFFIFLEPKKIIEKVV